MGFFDARQPSRWNEAGEKEKKKKERKEERKKETTGSCELALRGAKFTESKINGEKFLQIRRRGRTVSRQFAAWNRSLAFFRGPVKSAMQMRRIYICMATLVLIRGFGQRRDPSFLSIPFPPSSPFVSVTWLSYEPAPIFQPFSRVVSFHGHRRLSLRCENLHCVWHDCETLTFRITESRRNRISLRCYLFIYSFVLVLYIDIEWFEDYWVSMRSYFENFSLCTVNYTINILLIIQLTYY